MKALYSKLILYVALSLWFRLFYYLIVNWYEKSHVHHRQ